VIPIFHMGIIEDTIFTVYRDAITSGDMNQAEHTIDLVKLLRQKIDVHGFIDPANPELQKVALTGNFFEPFPYRYDEERSIVVFGNSAILLTKQENHFFRLLTLHETGGIDVKPITHDMIKKHMWDERNVSGNALRIAIKRIREKIEVNKEKPQVLINYYNNGYLFLGKRLIDETISHE